jgi:hypothetical protein
MRLLPALLAVFVVPAAVLAAESQPKPDDIVNNPPFAHWSAFAVGTSVTQQETVNLSDGTKLQESITSKLVEKTKDKVVVETSTKDKSSGAAEETKTVTTFPAKVKMSQVNTPDSAMTSVTEGKETVDVKGKKVDAEWVEAVIKSGDEVTTEKVWTARDIPGGIVKRTLTRKQGDKVVSDSVLELVEFK